MSTEIVYYSLNDFNEIVFSGNVNYTLDISTEQIIANLASILGIANTDSLPTTQKYTNSNKSRGFKKEIDESWLQPKFKTTVIEKKDGVMNSIRSCLNKLSEKNYDTNKIELLELIDNLESEQLTIVANNIFDIASTNKFYSKIYAKLYKELLNKFTIFDEILQNFISVFTETMKNIQYVEQNKNYDEFCEYNKKNDKRKATSVFIVNLVSNEVLSVSTLSDIVMKVQSVMSEYMNVSDKTNEVEEITENLFLLIHSILKNTNEWPTILENITHISKCKAKDYPSLTSRCIFKHLDILDIIEKPATKK